MSQEGVFIDTLDDNSRKSNAFPLIESFLRLPSSNSPFFSTKYSNIMCYHQNSLLLEPTPHTPSHQSHNIKIYFPYNPYISQRKLLDNLVDALELKNNALIESPTGTGKTLSLLCGSLAWLDTRRKTQDLSTTKIIYACKTPSQMKNILRELNKTAYRPRTCILQGNHSFCLRQERNNSYSLEQIQAEHVQYDSSEYFKSLDYSYEKEHLGKFKDNGDSIIAGEMHIKSPCYLEKEIAKDAELIILTHQYILDPKVREYIFQSETINSLENKIIIFDEAHNIEKSAQDGISFTLTPIHLEKCLEGIELLKQKNKMSASQVLSSSQLSEQNLNWLKFGFKIIKQELIHIISSSTVSHLDAWEQEGMLVEGPEIKKVFKGVHYELSGYSVILELLEKGISILSEIKQDTSSFDHLAGCIKLVDKMQRHLNQYWLTFTSSNNEKDMSLTFQCVDASLAFADIKSQRPRSIIMTSNTLRPFDLLKDESDIGMESLIEPVIKGKDLLYTIILKKGVKGNKLNFNYQNRNNDTIIRDMGLSLLEIAKITPNGLIVCFPSYCLMNRFIEFWEFDKLDSGMDLTLLMALKQQKELFIEPRDSLDAQLVIQNFKKSAFTSKGAVLLGVLCGSKLFEETDFLDECSRSIVIIGMPFSKNLGFEFPAKEIFVNPKRRSSQISNRGKILSDLYFNNEACGKINLSLGRSLGHHQHDYSILFLCDERFANEQIIMELPTKTKTKTDIVENIFDIKSKIKTFLDDNQQKLEQSKAVRSKAYKELIRQDEKRLKTNGYNLLLSQEEIDASERPNLISLPIFNQNKSRFIRDDSHYSCH